VLTLRHIFYVRDVHAHLLVHNTHDRRYDNILEGNRSSSADKVHDVDVVGPVLVEISQLLSKLPRGEKADQLHAMVAHAIECEQRKPLGGELSNPVLGSLRLARESRRRIKRKLSGCGGGKNAASTGSHTSAVAATAMTMTSGAMGSVDVDGDGEAVLSLAGSAQHVVGNHGNRDEDEDSTYAEAFFIPPRDVVWASVGGGGAPAPATAPAPASTATPPLLLHAADHGAPSRLGGDDGHVSTTSGPRSSDATSNSEGGAADDTARWGRDTGAHQMTTRSLENESAGWVGSLRDWFTHMETTHHLTVV
jgi:hypothetical protein